MFTLYRLYTLLPQTEPDLWHYIDNVLVEELLFGEEHALADHGGAKAGHRRGLAASSGHNVAKEANHTECDPDHLDDAVTLHYVRACVRACVRTGLPSSR